MVAVYKSTSTTDSSTFDFINKLLSIDYGTCNKWFIISWFWDNRFVVPTAVRNSFDNYPHVEQLMAMLHLICSHTTRRNIAIFNYDYKFCFNHYKPKINRTYYRHIGYYMHNLHTHIHNHLNMPNLVNTDLTKVTSNLHTVQSLLYS